MNTTDFDACLAAVRSYAPNDEHEQRLCDHAIDRLTTWAAEKLRLTAEADGLDRELREAQKVAADASRRAAAAESAVEVGEPDFDRARDLVVEALAARCQHRALRREAQDLNAAMVSVQTALNNASAIPITQATHRLETMLAESNGQFFNTGRVPDVHFRVEGMPSIDSEAALLVAELVSTESLQGMLRKCIESGHRSATRVPAEFPERWSKFVTALAQRRHVVANLWERDRRRAERALLALPGAP